MLNTKLLALGLCLALAGCSGKDGKSGGQKAASTDKSATASKSEDKAPSAPAAAAPSVPAGERVATVNGRHISKADFEKELEKFPEQIRSTPHGRKYVLDNLVEQTLLVGEAETRGIDKKTDFVRMMEDYKRRTLKDMILKELTDDDFQVTEADLRKYFDEHPEQFDRPSMVRAAHILVDTEAEAKKSLGRVKSGEDFKEVAKQISKDPYASATGGDLGWFSKDQRPEYADKVFALKRKGDVTGPVKTSRGWHVFKLVDRRAPEKKSFEQAKETLRRRLQSQKRSTAYRDFIAKLRETAKIDVNDSLVGAAEEAGDAAGKVEPAKAPAPAPKAPQGGGQ